MICDVNPEHGTMKIEPMYGKDNEILQYGWFCQVPGCDGYGGPVVKKGNNIHDTQKETE